MFRKNLSVVFKPMKNNSVLLPESYFQQVKNYENGCICMSYDHDIRKHYTGWAPYGSNMRDTEIGINSNVAKAIGIKEGSIVTCTIIPDVPVVDSISVSANTQKDWEMLEVSSYRIQSTMLDQTSVVTNGQQLIIWINPAMFLSIKVDRLSPHCGYGKLVNRSEVFVAPYRELSSASIEDIKPISTEDILRRSKSFHSNGFSNRHSYAFDTEMSKATAALLPSYSNGSSSNNATPTTNNTTNGRYAKQEPSIKSILPLPLSTSQTKTPTTPTTNNSNSLLDMQKCRGIVNLLKELQLNGSENYYFRVISMKWQENQMSDLFITKHNIPEKLKQQKMEQYVYNLITNEKREYFVNIKIKYDIKKCPENLYPTIEMNNTLMTRLGVKPFEHISLRPSKSHLILPAERIEIIPIKSVDLSQSRDIEHEFKQYIIDNSTEGPVVINQEQIYKLNDNGYVTINIYPNHLKYCALDRTSLRQCRINCSDKCKEIENINNYQQNGNGSDEDEDDDDDNKLMLNKAKKTNGHSPAKLSQQNGIQTSASFANLSGCSPKDPQFMELNKFGIIIDESIERTKLNLGLDKRNVVRKMGNLIIVGKHKSGKSTISKIIMEKLVAKPFCCHTDVFYCSKNKGRKPESIQRDLRQILNICISLAPSILILDNLDTLTQNCAEQTQDGEYYNRVSDVIQHLILEYTNNNAISVIATVTNKNNLNKRIFSSRGRHLFHNMYQIPELDKMDREKIIENLCRKTNIGSINYKKFANLTEGYCIGDLVEFVDRAIFYAYRSDSKNPILSNDFLSESLKITNAYCLQGIELNNSSQTNGNNNEQNKNNHDSDDSDDNSDSDDDDNSDNPKKKHNDDFNCNKSRKIAGLESVVSILEEVLIWPAKYPTIFDKSPLRNQAGVLLFGPPGTGKTYLVGKLAKLWHLRLISVKGPELLAKYIGQSEENVRNLFDRAKSAKPCVLFFDEFDSLAPKRGHDSTGVTDRVVNQLLTELDGVEGLNGVIVIAATSRPELLDAALLRSGRLDRLVECPLPDQEARLGIFSLLSKSLHFYDNVNLDYFAEKSENWTGADIQSMLTSANMTAVKELLEIDSENVPDKVFIKQDHMMDAFINTRPSLSGVDIAKYRQMYARFTNKEKPSREFVAKRATLA